MALDGSYAGLQASVIDHAFRTGDSVFAAAVPDFIRAAEVEMGRSLRVRQMITVDPAFSITGEFVNVPADFEDDISFSLSDGTVLDCKPLGQVADDDWAAGNVSGEPNAYAVVGQQFQFGPAPDATYTARLVYYATLPQLGATVGGEPITTNWLLTRFPDAYLYGALLKSAPYLDDEAKIDAWRELYTAALGQISGAYAETYGDRLQMQPSTFAA